MLKLVALIVVLSGVNYSAYAQACAKCCGASVLIDVAHRSCDNDWIGHVSECTVSIYPSACCQNVDEYNDVCAHPEMTEWGLHGCYEW
jgi:hypothetical protein